MKFIFITVYNFLVNNSKRLIYLMDGILPYFYNSINHMNYDNITFDSLLNKKKSNSVFICGTGPSINKISKKTWKQFEKYDVVSFRNFPKLNKVNVDFHITAEIDDVKSYAKDINENPKYKNTYFLIQKGFRAIKGNTLIGKKFLNLNSKIFRFKRIKRGEYSIFSKKIEDGIVHGYNSLTSVINIAYLMGWKKIILVGIDMHTHSYFYNPSNQIREIEKKGIDIETPFTNREKTCKMISIWKKELEKHNVELFVFNKNSYLRKILPYFSFDNL